MGFDIFADVWWRYYEIYTSCSYVPAICIHALDFPNPRIPVRLFGVPIFVFIWFLPGCCRLLGVDGAKGIVA